MSGGTKYLETKGPETTSRDNVRRQCPEIKSPETTSRDNVRRQGPETMSGDIKSPGPNVLRTKRPDGQNSRRQTSSLFGIFSIRLHIKKKY